MKIDKAISLGVSLSGTELRREVNYVNRLIGQAKGAFRDLDQTLKLIDGDLKEGVISREVWVAATNKAILASEKKTAQIKKEAKEVQALSRAEIDARNRSQGLSRQAFLQGIDSQAEAGRKALAQRLAAYKKEKQELEKINREREKAAEVVRALSRAEIDARNRSQGLSRQTFLQGIDSQAEAGRKALAQRLAAYKKEQAAIRELAKEQRLAQEARSNRRLAEGRSIVRSLETEEEKLTRRYREQTRALQLLVAEERKRGNLAGVRRANQASIRARDQFASDLRELQGRSRQEGSAYPQGRSRQEELAYLQGRSRQEGLAFLRQYESSQQRVNRALAEARGHFNKGRISAKEYADVTRQIHLQNSSLVAGFRQFRGAMLALVGPLVLITKTYQTLGESLRLGRELDAARAKFRVFMGTVSEANALLADIRQLSTTSPVSFAGGQRAATTLLQFGVEPGKISSSLRQIAEITGGSTERMESLALAFAQSQAAGRLMGQELLQMVNAGFNPLKVISDQTGKSLVQLKKEMEQGAISSEAIARAFRDATAQGGRFNGLLDEIADTSAGRMVRFQSQWEQFLTAFGNNVEKLLKGPMRALGNAFEEAANFLSDNQVAPNFEQRIRKQLEEAKTALEAGPVAIVSGMAPIDTSFLAKQQEEALEKRIKLLRQQLAIVKDIENVQRRAVEGRQLSSVERLTLDQYLKLERVRKNLNPEDFLQAQKEHLRNMEKASSEVEKAQKQLAFIERAGRGFFDDNHLAKIEAWTKLVERAEKQAAQLARVDSAFLKSEAEAQTARTRMIYGDDASRVLLIREQSVDRERDVIDALIKQGAAYDKILEATNETARARAKRLSDLEAETKALEEQQKAEERIKDFREEAQRLVGNVTNFDRITGELGRLQAMLRLGFLDRDTFNQQQRKLLSGLHTKTADEVNAPPRAVQRGSAEALDRVAKAQVEAIKRQLKDSDRSYVLAKAHKEATEKAVKVLDEIKQKPGVLPI